MKISLIALLLALIVSTAMARSCLTLYEHVNYRGRRRRVCGSANHMGSRFWNDRVSSACTGPNTYAYLYQHVNYRGHKILIRPNTCLRHFRGFNDKVSSFRVYRKSCRNHCRRIRRRRCRRHRYRRAVIRRRRVARYANAYRYVRRRHSRRVCYMRRVQRGYSYLSYYGQRVRYRRQYLKRVRYRAWQGYSVRVRRHRSVRYRHYYYVNRRYKRVTRRRRRVRYSRLVWGPARCRKPFWHYYNAWARRSYLSYCTRRQSYITTVRVRGRCRRPYRQRYKTGRKIRVNGNCYKLEYKWRTRYRYVNCLVNRRVRRWKNVRYRCRRWRRVRVRRRRIVYRVGNYCRKRYKRYYYRWYYYNHVQYYNRRVRVWRWAKRNVPYYVTVRRRRLVTRTKLVVAYTNAYRVVRRVKRVHTKRWTMVPAFRTVYYYTRHLQRYRRRYFVVKQYRAYVNAYRTRCNYYYTRHCRRSCSFRRA